MNDKLETLSFAMRDAFIEYDVSKRRLIKYGKERMYELDELLTPIIKKRNTAEEAEDWELFDALDEEAKPYFKELTEIGNILRDI